MQQDLNGKKIKTADKNGWYDCLIEGEVIRVDVPLSVDSCHLPVVSCLPSLDNLIDLKTLTETLQKETKNQPELLKLEFTMLGNSTNKVDIRLMQWNMLSQALSTGKDNFSRCPEECLQLPFRAQRILLEIARMDADIICLQEVDLFAYLQFVLGKIGYKATFLPKPDSPALYCQLTYGPDGCAIFYKKSKLNLIETQKIVLKKDNGQYTNQVCLLVTFETNDKKMFTVATTHLKAKSGWEQLRKEQGSYLISYLEKHYTNKTLILCGDLNADPTEEVYNVMTNSPLNISSAYKSVLGKEPKYTTWKIRGGENGERDVSRTIDYVFFTEKYLKLHTIKQLSNEIDIGPNRLPGWHYPSDHLALVVDFTFL